MPIDPSKITEGALRRAEEKMPGSTEVIRRAIKNGNLIQFVNTKNGGYIREYDPNKPRSEKQIQNQIKFAEMARNKSKEETE